MSQALAEKAVQASPADNVGLTTQEAEERLKQYGANDPAPARRHSAITELLLLFLNPLGIILLIAAVISGFIGQLLDAGIIVAMVLVGAGINFYQTYRSKIAIESLRARVAPTATLLRDGRWQEMDRKKLVPGDTIRLCAGDLVPSDTRLLVARDLYVQQAALTGESLPAEKEADG
ncbi:MAG TPA: cation-transporting P-type ATPase, partial [Candidatus Limnocylindrales bacterium]|nr:cation-transporting P-type ATPase [Candidatus Limnocylindrales bacterium]